MEQEQPSPSRKERLQRQRWWKLGLLGLSGVVLILGGYSLVLTRKIEHLQQQLEHTRAQGSERGAYVLPKPEVERWFSSPFFEQRFEPFAGLTELQQEMERAFSAFPDFERMTLSADTYWQDTGEEYQLAFPVDPQAETSASVSIEEGSVVVEIETKALDASLQGGMSQFSKRSQKVLPIPADADPEGLRQSLEGGTLRIVLPKRS